MHHVDNRADASTFLAHHNAPGILELHFGGGVGAIAKLILDSLNKECVAFPVRCPARHQKTGQADIGIGQREEGIAHWSRAKILVSRESVFGTDSRGAS
ncbi:MAG: hypothetical protein VX690_03530, partial [Pseudomonadota bacterium]|nr:hypothetical protein [Pseudomonadota bacterium]